MGRLLRPERTRRCQEKTDSDGVYEEQKTKVRQPNKNKGGRPTGTLKKKNGRPSKNKGGRPTGTLKKKNGRPSKDKASPLTPAASPAVLCMASPSTPAASPSAHYVASPLIPAASPEVLCMASPSTPPASPSADYVASPLTPAASPAVLCMISPSTPPASQLAHYVASPLIPAASPAVLCMAIPSTPPASPSAHYVASPLTPAASPAVLCMASPSTPPASPAARPPTLAGSQPAVRMVSLLRTTLPSSTVHIVGPPTPTSAPSVVHMESLPTLAVSPSVIRVASPPTLVWSQPAVRMVSLLKTAPPSPAVRIAVQLRQTSSPSTVPTVSMLTPPLSPSVIHIVDPPTPTSAVHMASPVSSPSGVHMAGLPTMHSSQSLSPYAKLREEMDDVMSDKCFSGYNLQDGPKLTLVRLYRGDNPGIQTSVIIDENFTASIRVHRVQVEKTHDLWTGVPTLFKSTSDIKILISKLSRYNVCVGNHDKDMVSLVPLGAGISNKVPGITAYREGDFGASLDEHSYSTTVRSINCAFLVRNGIRCKMCQRYRGTLRKALSRQAQAATKPKPENSLSWTKANSQMTKPELIAKINDYKDHTKTLECKISKQNQEIRQLIRSQGAKLKEAENTDFESMFKECTPEVEEAYRDPHCFQRLFWQEQKRQMSLASKKSMRWHPMIIKWCLYLKSKSSKAYGAMRDAGFISLPSERTLFDYSHALPAKTGFQPEYAEHLKKEATVLGMYKEDWRAYVGILQDEMKIKEDLVYDRNTGELVGYMDLDKYGNTLLELERTITNKKRSIAKHVLVIMVRGITSKLKYPLAAFATDGVTADLLYTVLWKAIEILELSCRLKVLFITCDGASPNRRFFTMNHVGEGDKRVGYWTINRFAQDGRRLFFISDVPHLIKTTRNCFANSGAGSRTRMLWKDGKDMSWMHILRLYEDHVLPNVFSQAYKLTHAHVHLTPFARMKVDLAVQVMSSTVANALELNYGEDVSETVNFIRHMNRFFDCLNTRHPGEADYTRIDDRAKYSEIDDSRLTYLTTEFLGYFRDWRASIETVHGHLNKSDKAKMMLSHQTLNGLVITVSSITECIKFLLAEGAEYVLTHRFNQDPLEAHFSHYRHKGGANDNPTLYDVKNTLTTLRVIGSTALDPIRGNIKRRPGRDNNICNEPLPKRKCKR